MGLSKEPQRFFDAVILEERADAEKVLATGKVDLHALRDGLGVLHAACNICNLEGVRFLLDKGADVNPRRTQVHKTALFHAVMFPDRLELLLEAGADPNLLDAQGQTVLAYAQSIRWRPGASSGPWREGRGPGELRADAHDHLPEAALAVAAHS